MSDLTSKPRPSRRNYPESLSGDLAFNMALVSWQGTELDRLTARVAELEGALQQIASGMRGGQVMYASEYWAIARAALGERT